MIELIAIDLDGTLLRSDKTLSEANLEAIHFARKKGVKVVLCTGRPYLGMIDFVNQIGFTGEDEYLVVFNGAQVRKAKDGQIIVDETVSQADLVQWYKETERVKLPLNPIDNEWVYDPIAYPEDAESLYTTTAPRKTVDFDNFTNDHTFNKFVITLEAEKLQKRLALVDPSLFERYQTVLSHPYQLEVVKAGVNKGQALQLLGQVLGIEPANMMTIGDQNNDLTMIELAGYGVAMGNAIDEIKAIATYVTDTNDNDGVAKAIYHYIKDGE